MKLNGVQPLKDAAFLAVPPCRFKTSCADRIFPQPVKTETFAPRKFSSVMKAVGVLSI